MIGRERVRSELEPGGPCEATGDPAPGHHIGRCVESMDACEMGLYMRRLEGERERENEDEDRNIHSSRTYLAEQFRGLTSPLRPSGHLWPRPLISTLLIMR